MEVAHQLPDERSLRADVAAGPFQLGVCQGRWKLGAIEWPFTFIAITSGERPNAPAEWWFRFDCSGYPDQAPTAIPWDEAAKQPLPGSRWPGGRSRIPAVFRPDWQNGRCLYLPCDRIAAAGHEKWRNDHPSLIWSPARGIVMYVQELYALLNSSDYTGVRNG